MQVRVQGSGPDLMLLHGWAMRADIWSEVAEMLAPAFRVHVVDLNSFSGTITPDSMTEALANLDVRAATVCGWSLGGQVALRWARREPRQVTRLVLIATTPRFVNGTDWNHGMDRADFDRFVQDFGVRAEETLNHFALLQAHGDTRGRDVARRLREEITPVSRDTQPTLDAGLRMLEETDLRAQLPAISQPALIVHGERDSVIPLAAGAYLARELDDAQLQVIAGAAHAPFISNPDLVAGHIRTFCDG